MGCGKLCSVIGQCAERMRGLERVVQKECNAEKVCRKSVECMIVPRIVPMGEKYVHEIGCNEIVYIFNHHSNVVKCTTMLTQ
jgi:hypothetical protein